jgi:predicted acetyltransferase
MILIYQPPNAHVRISEILLRNAMAAAAMKKIYCMKKGLYKIMTRTVRAKILQYQHD